MWIYWMVHSIDIGLEQWWNPSDSAQSLRENVFCSPNLSGTDQTHSFNVLITSSTCSCDGHAEFHLFQHETIQYTGT